MADHTVVIVGAGPAGMRAAETLVRAGLRPMVVDEQPASGGQIYRRPPAGFKRTAKALYGTEVAKAEALHRGFDALADRIDYRPDTAVWGLKDDRLFLQRGEAAEDVRFERLILATGATDRLLPVPGWTLPGVYTLGAAQIALKAQGVTIGAPVVFLGSGPLLFLVASQYIRAGAKVAAVLDTSRFIDQARALPWLLARPVFLARGVGLRRALLRAGVPVHSGVTPERILGDTGSGVAGLRWLDKRGRSRETAANAIGLGWHLRSEIQLAELAGCEMTFDPLMRQWRPLADRLGRSSRGDIYLAGDGARICGADGAEIAGRLAASAVLEDMSLTPDRSSMRALLRRHARMKRFAEGIWRAFPWPADLCAAVADETILCRCEEVTTGDFRRTIAETDAPELNRAKAICRVGMGRCQGRYCSLAAAEIMARSRGCRIAEAGRLRPQAPIKPLSAAVRRK
jgi:NADPH-dependent 2,4-dienoyl-CoA reductase/sulfur reductase-like enzyme